MAVQLGLFGNYRKTLEKVREACVACRKCPYHLRDERRVHGYGKEGCALVIVGQGPGPREVESGRPFSGHSGTLLNRELASVGISRFSVYKTNVLKCGQPEDASILQSAAKACMEYLDDELGILKPRLILCLGAVAAEHVARVRRENFSGSRGRFVPTKYSAPDGSMTYAVPMYNPAYLLRIRREEYYTEVARAEHVILQSIVKYLETGEVEERIPEPIGGGDEDEG